MQSQGPSPTLGVVVIVFLIGLLLSHRESERLANMFTELYQNAKTATALVTESGSVIVVDGKWHNDSAVAWARYIPSFNRTGWDQLGITVTRSSAHAAPIAARAAGILEAFFQAPQMYNYWTNYRLNTFNTAGHTPPQALQAYVREQAAWVDSQIAANRKGSKYWATMELVVAQFEGLCEGYWRYTEAAKNLTWTELYLLNSVGDLYDLNVKYQDDNSTSSSDNADDSTGSAGSVPAAAGGQQAVRPYRPTPGHGMVGPGGFGDMLECSAVIKLQTAANGRRTFLAAHTTWRPYYAMVRTWKVYDFPWAATGPLQIASSPGLLHSKDDWYTTGRLVVMETTNGIYNESLYDALGPNCALTWQRVQVANFAATSATEWVELFSIANSGTYNNQWMVLDSEAVSSGASTGALVILEQIPGYAKSADVSDVLQQQGHWVSYNVPYFEEIYNLSGYPYPSIYATCPRAQIFSRDVPNVTSLWGLKQLIRGNSYLTDPLSLGLPNNAIAARYDLPAAPHATSPRAVNWTRHPYGAVDAKVTSTHLLEAGRQLVIAGPTTAHGLPPFSWADPEFENTPHEGCVERYSFTWVQMRAGLCPALPQQQGRQAAAVDQGRRVAPWRTTGPKAPAAGPVTAGNERRLRR